MPASKDHTQTILLAVVGMSPAVLTETIWALAQEPAPVLPHRVVVVTTVAGRRKIEQQLFAPIPQFGNRCAWDALREGLVKQGHSLTGRLRFGATPDDIRVITALDPATGRSQELADIRNPAENEAAADFLLEQVRTVAENPDSHLLASIAGGRKTMGALLYACMTLAGRETDRLTHVLVSEPYETLPEFFFPAQPGGPVAGRDSQPFDPQKAKIELADVTFVPLRNLFLKELNRPAGNFATLVHTCRANINRQAGENIRFEIDNTRTEMLIDGQPIQSSPREHALMLFLANRAKRNEAGYLAYKDAIDPLNEFVSRIRQTAPANSFADWRHSDNLESKYDDQELRRIVSSIRDRVKHFVPAGLAFANCLPERGRFSLQLPGPMIHIK